MENLTPDLCDEYPDLVEVVEPLFSNFGGRVAFGGVSPGEGRDLDARSSGHAASARGR